MHQRQLSSGSWAENVAHGALALGGLSRHISFGWADLWQAAIFAGLHDGWNRFVYLFVLALIAGWLTRKTKGLAMPILLHAINNAIFIHYVVST